MLNIDISHFTGKGHGTSKSEKWRLDDILVENSKYSNLESLKRRLIKNKILVYECEICKVSKWRGEKLSLHLDHKNGINNDHRIFNIRLLCPNCHSQTDTYSGKNNTKRLPKYCSCGKKISRLSVNCKKCSDVLKLGVGKVTERPSLGHLLEGVNRMGYTGVGEKYGVSGNTIRKWIINYGKIPPRTISKNGRK